MNKLIVYNKITNYINERFDEMTTDEFADLQAGDGTMSILDGIIENYERQGYMFNCHEIEMFADYIGDKTSEYYAAHEFDNISTARRVELGKYFMDIASQFAEACKDNDIDYDDQDEWLEWLRAYEGEVINFTELQYINTLWNETTKQWFRQ
jgi:hypothetical protein